VKTKVQVDSKPAGPILRELYRGGVRSFARGAGARVGWIVPSMTCSMVTYELLKDYYSRGHSASH
jgi:Mitochondrial carrier protein